MSKNIIIIEDEPIHDWFGLTYANYLVLQRSILQSAPVVWQKKFVKLLDELQEMTSELKDLPGKYVVQIRDERGRFTTDYYADYDRGRRIIVLKTKKR